MEQHFVHKFLSFFLCASAYADVDFLEKRRDDWESSFRSLYCMLRKNLCSIFYGKSVNVVLLFNIFVLLRLSKFFLSMQYILQNLWLSLLEATFLEKNDLVVLIYQNLQTA